MQCLACTFYYILKKYFYDKTFTLFFKGKNLDLICVVTGAIRCLVIKV